jgi:hypothetical protein
MRSGDPCPVLSLLRAGRSPHVWFIRGEILFFRSRAMTAIPAIKKESTLSMLP